jgi:hypothetical protein
LSLKRMFDYSTQILNIEHFNWLAFLLENYFFVCFTAKMFTKGSEYFSGILNKLWGLGTRVGIGLSYRPASAVVLEQSLGATNRIVMGCRTGSPGYIGRRNQFLRINS